MTRSTHARRPRRADRRRPALASAVGLVLLTTGCAGEAASGSTPAAGPATPHGYVAGAAELTEPQLQLGYLDASGAAHALDLLTGETTDLGAVGPAGSVASDGRFLFVSSEPAGQLTVVDTGSWTVDHGDHTHYYRAEPRVVGTLDWAGEVRVGSSERVTALFSPTTGGGVVLDREALGRGDLEQTATVGAEPHDGVLLPLGDGLVGTDGDRVRVLDAAGEPAGGEGAACPGVRGGAATRVGVVVSCADGAVLATEADGAVTFESIPYPTAVADGDRAAVFAQRPGRPGLAAPAGDRGVWLLDTRAAEWQLVETPTPLLRAVAVDDDRDRVVALDATGRVVVIEPDVGVVATTDVLVGSAEDLATATVEVDADRAYVNVASAGVVHEIDYVDGARVARSLETVVAPAFLAETGR
ncbi:hypothetical protein [Modestobacter versicolor]|uniref:hypothetical protein n=1 Tax=Modestobacter versicolor TaxID=429133 RepID=UPI0034DE5E3D